MPSPRSSPRTPNCPSWRPCCWAAALAGMAQVSARYWLETDGNLDLDVASDLIYRLAWRGISSLPQGVLDYNMREHLLMHSDLARRPRVEVKIGIQNIGREIVLDSAQDAEAVAKMVCEAIAKGNEPAPDRRQGPPGHRSRQRPRIRGDRRRGSPPGRLRRPLSNTPRTPASKESACSHLSSWR